VVHINNTNGDELHKIVLGDAKYVHEEDNEKTYLIDQSNKKVKQNFSLNKHIIGKNLTSETKLEGIGTVKAYGELNLEKLVDRLLKSSLTR
jgi:hypothetical protein